MLKITKILLILLVLIVIKISLFYKFLGENFDEEDENSDCEEYYEDILKNNL